jgi:hypothetical protein
MKWTMYLLVWRAIQWDSEWKEIYERLLPAPRAEPMTGPIDSLDAKKSLAASPVK